MIKRSRFEYALLGVLGVAVAGSTLALARRGGDYAFFDPLIDIRRILSTRYVDTIDDQRLQRGAIDGMIRALDDPYTVFVPAEERSDFDKELTGEYVGIGAQVGQDNGWLSIVTPLEDSPAYKAGLLAGDRVISIDGTETNGISIDRCIELLSGMPGTPVKIVVERDGKRFDLTITRDKIKTRSVKGFRRSDTDPAGWNFTIDPALGIAYLRLTQFTPGCAREVAQALEAAGVARGSIKGLVLDLRWNPGGLLSEAVTIADLFLQRGTIVSTRGRAFPEQKSEAQAQGTLPDFPIAVILNASSASASEVLAGALVENERAVVVGTRSFGKGSVQSVINLPSLAGAELKITEQGYYLPSGRSIQRRDDSPVWGVDPTKGFYVPMTTEQTIEMLRVRREREIIQNEPRAAGESAAPDPDAILAELKDPQLDAAVRAVRGRLTTGQWTPTGQDHEENNALALDELRQLSLARERLERELARLDRRVDALESASGGKATAGDRDFWDDALDLSGGTLTITDRDGKPVSSLRITGPNLERWLLDADVERAPTPPAPSKP